MKVIIDNSLWGEVSCQENACTYRFFSANMPADVGGNEGASDIRGNIACSSPEEAESCCKAIINLINSGYGEEIFWLCALDMKDLTSEVFCGKPMKYLSAVSFDKSDVERIKGAVIEAEFVFCAFSLGPDKNEKLSEIDGIYGEIVGCLDVDVWLQISPTRNADEKIDVWYR